jgi:sugar phosphate isomerase/epimerase
VRLLVDSYHWSLDGDSYEDIVRYGDLLHHVHVATTDARVPPGFEPCPACAIFFEALGEAGYDGPISIEAQWDDIEQQAGAAYKHLRSLIS